MIDDLNFIIEAVVKIKDKHGKVDYKGTMECPKCKGVLHYTVSSYNGHVWGKCENKDCLQWVE